MKTAKSEQDSCPMMTTSSGRPVGDNQNSVTAGPNGPVLMEDYLLFEKMAQFNRERIPERVVHAKGAGAHGTFTVTGDITKYTSARVFSKIGKGTKLLARFSTVAGEKGSADTARDPRGFSVKFYTEEGNWDMTGNNTPVFFVRDALKFSDFIHSQKRVPATNLRSPTVMWDFWSLSPESLHQVTILFSDRGIPDGHRHMHGFSSHTFSLINAKGERCYCKWHFLTLQGIKNLTPQRAEVLAGTDPDYSTRDLHQAIERGDFPKWRLCVQIMPEVEAATYPIHPFDLTKVWPHKDYPLVEVGLMELNANPKNYFNEVEQAAFSPVNIVPGMGYSPDKVLQARLISYPDAHRYRLGVNFETLPVNRPLCPVHTYNRAGSMRLDENGGEAPNYEPNSFAGPAQDSRYRELPYKLSGDVNRYSQSEGNDDYSQAGDLFRLMNPVQKKSLIMNLATHMAGIPERIAKLQIAHFTRADPAYGRGVAEALGIALPEPALMSVK
jgi:catalase